MVIGSVRDKLLRWVGFRQAWPIPGKEGSLLRKTLAHTFKGRPPNGMEKGSCEDPPASLNLWDGMGRPTSFLVVYWNQLRSHFLTHSHGIGFPPIKDVGGGENNFEETYNIRTMTTGNSLSCLLGLLCPGGALFLGNLNDVSGSP